MPVLILAGLSHSLVVRVKAALQKFQTSHPLPLGWNIKFAYIDEKKLLFSEKVVKLACKTASESTDSHIVGIRNAEGNSNEIARQFIKPFFRFRWFEGKHLPLIYHPDQELINRLSEIIQEEEYWRNNIKPDDIYHPLLLPKDIFNSQCKCQNLWEICDTYGDFNNLHDANRKIKIFTTTYQHTMVHGGRGWKDTTKLLFDPNGARHGDAPDFHRWKYSFQLPEGFHYDVNHEREQAFHVRDAKGVTRSATQGGHLNIDPHGHVRS
ncbi:hypothetical protein SIID45300_01905 [Candidatus Magnetaquicoccaceae bacterium FCR-1]|uniref:Uncharacterized protein n=1 Tax=Candidatus Magnetaquiglobus chichijimensis TaxID=3141448 RepID=A0ABQ0C9L0_9PROT